MNSNFYSRTFNFYTRCGNCFCFLDLLATCKMMRQTFLHNTASKKKKNFSAQYWKKKNDIFIVPPPQFLISHVSLFSSQNQNPTQIRELQSNNLIIVSFPNTHRYFSYHLASFMLTQLIVCEFEKEKNQGPFPVILFLGI